MTKLTRKELWAQGPLIKIIVDAIHPFVETPDGSQGLAVFKAFVTDVEDRDGNPIGSIGGGTGAVTLSYEGKTWLIRHSDLWHAFMEAVKK